MALILYFGSDLIVNIQARSCERYCDPIILSSIFSNDFHLWFELYLRTNKRSKHGDSLAMQPSIVTDKNSRSALLKLLGYWKGQASYFYVKLRARSMAEIACRVRINLLFFFFKYIVLCLKTCTKITFVLFPCIHLVWFWYKGWSVILLTT